jgi:hypothetical protein
MKILNPWSELNAGDDLFKQLRITLDGEEIGFSEEKNHQDTYILFDTDFRSHRVVISRRIS